MKHLAHRPLAACLVMILLAGCCSLDMREETYQGRLKSLDGLAAQAPAAEADAIRARKKEFEAKYAGLPKTEEGKDALGTLNQEMQAYIQQVTPGVEAHQAATAGAAAAVEAAFIAEYRKGFVGHWKGDGMDLLIAPDGTIQYERLKGGSSRKLTGATISAFRRDAFDAKLLMMSTTFKIDRPPYQEGGRWHVVIDGAHMLRQDG